MDIMETTPQVSNDDSINQMQYTTQSNFEPLVTEELKNVPSTTYNHSEDTNNITLSSTTECSNELIINEDIVNPSQNDVLIEYPISTQSMEVLERVSSEPRSTDYNEEIPISENCSENVEYSAIPLQENIEQVGDTNENQENITKGDTILSTGHSANTSFSSETVQNISDQEEQIKEENTEIIDELKSEGKGELIINECNQHMEDESIPSFIGEVDESVSLPPAEPLILEHEEISQHNVEEVVQENVVEQLIQENVVDQLIQENVAKVIQGNVEKEIVTEKIPENEIEITEATHAEIVAEGETHIQYTVLPPGENSVYQEDGTLVVEYPLNNTTVLDENITKDSESSIETSGEQIEFVNIVVKQEKPPGKPQEKPQPKPKGRRPAGHIPLHILGHNIDKPVQDVPNGKQLLKPRLGVKIPYRNLASQIVSTTELRQQIVERARQKQEAQTHVDPTNIFAKKLTHRLAQSLSGKGKAETPKKGSNIETKLKVVTDPIDKVKNTEENLETLNLGENKSDPKITNPIEIIEVIKSENVESIETLQDNINSRSATNETSESTLEISNSPDNLSEILPVSDAQKSSLNIESNSDLIAILEGDGDEVSPIITMPKPLAKDSFDNNSSEIKEIEKEISLSEQKTIQVTPHFKEKKFFKSRDSRLSDNAKDKIHATKEKDTKVTTGPSSEKKNPTESKSSVSVSGDIKVHSNSIIQDSKSGPKSPLKGTDEKKLLKDGEKNLSDQKERKYTGAVIEVEPQLKPTMALKTYTRKRKSNDVSIPEPSKKPLIESPTQSNQPEPKIDFVSPLPPNVYVTKSSRVIKKKVIWDPDEAMPSVRNQSKILSKIESNTKGTPTSKVPTIITKSTPSKAVVEKKSMQGQTDPPKSTKLADKKLIKTVLEKTEKETAPADKQLMKKPDKTEIPKRIKSPAVVKSLTVVKSPMAVKSPTVSKIAAPIEEEETKSSPGKSPKKSTKRLTEIDRLLMDEGAVNMLYDINNSEDQKRRVSTRTAVSSNDKAQTQKELMDRTQEIKNELTQGTSADTAPKSLRKKESPLSAKKETKETAGPPAVRKMSKDSSKSSIHSPPPSPAAFTLAEASRIIRRHSSSSFSSNDELVQETLADMEEKEKERTSKKKAPPSEASNSKTPREVASEKNTKERPVKKKVPPTPEGSPRKRLKRERAEEMEEEQPQKIVEIAMKSEPGIATGELKTDPSRTFTLIKMNKHYMINLTYSGGDNYLTVQLLRDLTVTLKELVKNKYCNVVSIHSQGPAFCLGLDYKGLVESDEELRKKRAIELSSCVRDFLKCLLHFPKVIVAGIKGDCVGFGVTMLPLFDMIVASDTASFCTPYGKLGCAPEAGFLLSIPFQSNHGLASELLYTSQRMNADEAQRRGLVTKLFWPEKFDTEFRSLLQHISNLSKAGLMRTKKELRMLHGQSTEAALNSSCKMLVNFWRSEECQKNFLNYNALTFDIDQ